MAGKQKITLDLDYDLYLKIKEASKFRGMSAWVREAIQAKLLEERS